VTERIRLRTQAAEISFLVRVTVLSFRDRVRSSAIQRELGVEPLLLCTERNPLGLVKSPAPLPLEFFWEHPTGRKSWGRSRICKMDYPI